MLMSACEGSCRMCPFTTMSSNNAPSESRPLAMWVILRISPTKIHINIYMILLTAHMHQVEPALCIYINMYTCLYTAHQGPVRSYLWRTPPASLAWRCLLLACSHWQPLLLPAQWSSRQGSGSRWAFSLQDLEIKGRRRVFNLWWDLLIKIERTT